ncbi:MAG: amidohydrolase [Tissierellia bacterium]|nr:amidohydrolase [Tissierellia bacterium]
MILKNVQYYNSDKGEFIQSNILIKDGKYQAITEEVLEDMDGEVMDLQNRYMIPAYVNCHTHLAMSLFRNLADDMELMDWLQNKIWPLEDKLTAEDIYNGTLLSFLEMIASGTTTVNDMYFEEEMVSRAAKEAGVRGGFGQGLMDLDGNFDTRWNRVCRQYMTSHDEQTKVTVSPHAIYTMGGENIRRSKEFALEHGLIFHTHAAETMTEFQMSMENWGKTPIAYLESLGVLDEHTVLAHCVHLTDEDRHILAEYGCHVAINLSSNLKLGSGIPEIEKMMEAGVTLCVGTDGAASNNRQSMLQELQLISKVVKGKTRSPLIMHPRALLKMATVNGAKALGYEKLGEIKEGWTADFVIYNLDGIHNWPLHDPLSALIYSAMDSDVEMTVSNGKILYAKGDFPSLDQQEIKHLAKQSIEELKGR